MSSGSRIRGPLVGEVAAAEPLTVGVESVRASRNITISAKVESVAAVGSAFRVKYE